MLQCPCDDPPALAVGVVALWVSVATPLQFVGHMPIVVWFERVLEQGPVARLSWSVAVW